MDSFKSASTALGVTVVLGITAALYCVSRRSPPKSKKKQTGLRRGCKVLFFSEESNKCYNRDHKPKECSVEDCPVKHLRDILAVLQTAKSSVDVCLYNLTHPDLEETLINLIKKNVQVRCVFGSRKNDEKQFVKKLHKSGAFIKEKDHLPPPGLTGKYREISDLLMHHKFVIVDKKMVITGSMNWTVTSFSKHWDHILMCTNTLLVQQFQEEFDSLFGESTDNKRSSVTRLVTDVPFQVCFFRKEGLYCREDANKRKKCEREDCVYPLFRAVMFRVNPTSTLDICVQQLTLEDLSWQVMNAHTNGVKVRVICEKHMASGTGSQIKAFIDAGIPVHMQVGEGTLHHKFIIVDGKTLVSGSLNWTMQSFFGNYENILLVVEKGVVSDFQRQFDKLWTCFPLVTDF